ncbi:hypothetical protein L6452_34248 [Arctium lappa]|uniref:Uncharacterized protein n=1 Tax=Arctium lappa TaxID=4217 RepID=A0ACB8YIC9_ARCLA|nr:hypothetical protein L6452_34248 [Arctium lappa]
MEVWEIALSRHNTFLDDGSGDNLPASLTLSNNGDKDSEKDMDIQLWDNPDFFDTGLSPYKADKELCNDAFVGEDDMLHDDVFHGMADEQGYVPDVEKQNDEGRGRFF